MKTSSTTPSSAGQAPLGRAKVLASIGAMLMMVGVYVIYRVAASYISPEVQGTVLGRNLGSVGQTGRGLPCFRALRVLVDSTRSLGDASAAGSGSHVRNWMATPQKESAVKVHYNPLEVNDSTICTGISGGTA